MIKFRPSKIRMSSRLRNAGLFVACIAVAVLATFLLQNSRAVMLTPDSSNSVQSALKPLAPDVTFQTMRGPVSLQSLRGKVVVLNFWASWCAPCQVEIPKQLAMIESLSDDIVLVLLSSDDTTEAMHRFIQKLPPESRAALKKENVILAHDKDKTITQDRFQTLRLPETIIITPEGHMDRKIVGDSVDWQSQKMKNYLSGLRTKQNTPITE